MNEFYNLYVSVDSIACKKAINFLYSKNIPFIVTVVDRNQEFIQNLKISTNRQNLPIIFKQLKDNLMLIGDEKDLENFIATEENNGTR